MTGTILATRNEAWGFHGNILQLRGGHGADAGQAWRFASAAIATATGVEPEGVRDFLGSRHARHFADDVANGLARGLALQAAIDAAVARWMGWRIGRSTSRETGIPAGMPHLTGLAAHFKILAEVEAEG